MYQMAKHLVSRVQELLARRRVLAEELSKIDESLLLYQKEIEDMAKLMGGLAQSLADIKAPIVPEIKPAKDEDDGTNPMQSFGYGRGDK